MLKLNNNILIHSFFVLLLLLTYILSIILFNEIIIIPHDNLDIATVFDHIISKIYHGEIDSYKYFLGGEFKWYYLEKLFFPINIAQYFLDSESFYFFKEIFKKILSYVSFYIFAKSITKSKFNSTLGAFFYTSIINITQPFGLALSGMPYLLYLMLNKNKLNFKHVIFIIFLCLNSSIIQHLFTFLLSFVFIFFIRKEKINIKLYVKFFFLIFIPLIFAQSHIILGSIFGPEIHRVDMILRTDITTSALNNFNFFFYLQKELKEFIFYVLFSILILILILISFFSKDKYIKLILYLIFGLFILAALFDSNIVNIFFVGPFSLLKGVNLGRSFFAFYPILLSLLLVLNLSILNNNPFKIFFYIFSIFSTLILSTHDPIQEFFTVNAKNTLGKKFEEIKIYSSFEIFSLIELLNKNINFKDINFINLKSNKTFNNYYKFEDYKYIKKYLGNSRVLSVGVDPMIAVMNDIKVIDGYYTIYPKSYKIKFRKIIEKELDINKTLLNYYDKWGNRVYSFFNNKNNIKIDFKEAKKIGADYVISSFPILVNDLKLICEDCNNSQNLFLYKIL